jgi:hypothetical protein
VAPAPAPIDPQQEKAAPEPKDNAKKASAPASAAKTSKEKMN